MSIIWDTLNLPVDYSQNSWCQTRKAGYFEEEIGLIKEKKKKINSLINEKK